MVGEQRIGLGTPALTIDFQHSAHGHHFKRLEKRSLHGRGPSLHGRGPSLHGRGPPPVLERRAGYTHGYHRPLPRPLQTGLDHVRLRGGQRFRLKLFRNVQLSGPDININGPRNFQFGVPDLNINGPRHIQYSVPDFKLNGPGNFQFSIPDVNINGPRDVQLSVPDLNLKVGSNIRLPGISKINLSLFPHRPRKKGYH